MLPGGAFAARWHEMSLYVVFNPFSPFSKPPIASLVGGGMKANQINLSRIARVQRELMEQSWWGSLPWTSQDKGGRPDAQDGRGSACALGRGSPHRRPADPS